ncbi:hypothetical protein Tco_1456902 [Tanacetum coccineum]
MLATRGSGKVTMVEALANNKTKSIRTPISVNSAVVNGCETTTQLEGHKKFSNGGVIVVEDDPGVIPCSTIYQSDLALSTSLNDMEISALHIDGQSIDVDAPLDIIDVVDEDDDIIDEEDPIPHDLADSDDEDLINLDIDDGVTMQLMLHDGHRLVGVTVGGDDRPPYTRYHCCRGLLGQPERPSMLRWDHAAHLANYLGELVRELPLHHPSWCQVPPEQKAGVMAKIGTQFDIRPHMNLIAGHKSMRPSSSIYKRSTMARMLLLRKDWDAEIAFWNNLKNLARAAQNKQNRAKRQMESSATPRVPIADPPFFLTHLFGCVFLNLAPTPPRVCPTPRMRSWPLFSGASSGGTFPVLVGFCRDRARIYSHSPPCMHSFDVATLKKREKMLTKKMNMLMKLFRSDVKFSQMLTLLESQPEYDGGSGSGGCGDDEPGDDEDGGKDEEDEDDS